MASKATTVKELLAELPEDRRKAVSKVRSVIKKNLPKGFKETVQYGMIVYVVPLKTFPDTYNGQPLQLAAIASQKNYMSVYLTSVYAKPETLEWFTREYKATGKKLDMGKSCVRFKTLDDLPVELVGEVIAETSLEDFLETYKSVKA